MCVCSMYVPAPTAAYGTGGYFVSERYCGIISILSEPHTHTHARARAHTHARARARSDSVLRRPLLFLTVSLALRWGAHSCDFLWPMRLVHLLVSGRRAAALGGDDNDHHSSHAAAAAVRAAEVRAAAVRAAAVRPDAATVRADTAAVRAGATCHGATCGGTSCGISTTAILRLTTAHRQCLSDGADRDAVAELHALSCLRISRDEKMHCILRGSQRLCMSNPFGAAYLVEQRRT